MSRFFEFLTAVVMIGGFCALIWFVSYRAFETTENNWLVVELKHNKPEPVNCWQITAVTCHVDTKTVSITCSGNLVLQGERFRLIRAENGWEEAYVALGFSGPDACEQITHTHISISE